MSDDPLLECPECGEPALKRLLSAPRFRLKGEGWYETDFKKDNQKNVHKSDSEPAKSDGDKKPDKSTADKKSESKPKPKPKPKVKSED
jgi:predicted nucleic acid-binding Zn ribbon protein